MDRDADISETAKGDHLAFSRIVVAHQDRIFAYLGRMGLDSAMAEDIAQETFFGSGGMPENTILGSVV